MLVSRLCTPITNNSFSENATSATSPMINLTIYCCRYNLQFSSLILTGLQTFHSTYTYYINCLFTLLSYQHLGHSTSYQECMGMGICVLISQEYNFTQLMLLSKFVYKKARRYWTLGACMGHINLIVCSWLNKTNCCTLLIATSVHW